MSNIMVLFVDPLMLEGFCDSILLTTESTGKPDEFKFNSTFTTFGFKCVDPDIGVSFPGGRARNGEWDQFII